MNVSGDRLRNHVMLCVLACIPLLGYSYRLFLVDPQVLSDEAIIFDTSATLVTTGKLASHIYGDALARMESHSFGYPPLYYWLLATWMWTMGVTLEAGRGLSLLFGTIGIALVYGLAMHLGRSKLFAFGAAALVSADFFFGGAARTIRMDMITVSFTLASLLAYLLWKQKNALVWLVLAGTSAALAFLTHPLGSIASVTIACDLLWSKRRTTNLLHFLFPTGIALVIWGITIRGAPEIFVEQYVMQLMAKFSSPSSIPLFWQSEYINKVYLSFVGLMIVTAAFASFRYPYPGKRVLWIASAVTLVAVIVGKEQLYFVYVIPYVALHGIILIERAIKHRSHVHLFLIVFLVSIYGTTNVIYHVRAMKNASSEYYTFAHHIRSLLPTGASVLLATHPDPYFVLRNENDLRIMEFPMYIVPPNTYDLLWKQIDYVVANLENTHLREYLDHHTQSVTRVVSINGVATYLFTLKPLSERR